MLYKAFYEALKQFRTEPLKARKYLQDHRLSQMEKSVLNALFMIRENEFQAAVDTLKNKKSEFDFIEAQRMLTLGVAINNMGDFLEAEKYFLAAHAYLRDDSYFGFITSANLFLVNYNMQCPDKMKSYLNDLDALKDLGPKYKATRLRCHFKYCLFVNKLTAAEKFLAQIEKIKDILTESEKLDHVIDTFRYHEKKEDFASCYKMFDEMKRFRKFYVSENFIYLKKLLDHYCKNKPIYLLHDDFEHSKRMLWQLNVLQQLETGNYELAKEYWAKLMNHFPDTHHEDFEFTGEKCLFSLSLKKHLATAITKETVELREDVETKDYVDQLFYIFSHASAPLTKDELYEKVWKSKASSKEDYVRLSRSIYRLKKRYGLEVKTRKGSYVVHKKKVA